MAAGTATPVGIGVVGIEHLHVFELVDGLVAAGCTPVAHASASDSLADLYGTWQASSEPVGAEAVLSDPRVDVVVLAGVPADRADVAVAALEAGKDVLSAKPGVTTAAQLARVRGAATASGRRWWVLFSERYANPAVLRAVELARTGAIGRVVHVEASAPHRLSPDERPAWFFDRERAGGIVVDLGTHQVDHFLAATGADAADVQVVASAAGSTRDWGDDPARAGFEDVGELVLAAPGVRGHHRIDFLEPDGFPTWGDTRLVITGTDGRLEVRIAVGDDGQHEPAAVWITDHRGVHRDDEVPEATWARDLLADRADGGERFMARDHAFDVTALALQAAAAASGWGTA
ncbi:Gfo/Idh/MocA family protein [Dermatobacter hominis]|uniref:Gfo/Idh/MocA family protein n=1 Tax=Dermatobacter hominis TaxID=2884263 RepID=UPI001D1233E1|nr:Gfo/Idh/MocA family oxidoreductase [Dermatobacter hominis]UDY35381.1 Gfo/Idh/MocA family oxidoreductase [Dermatobacter hominis]